jgi:hypothetical protein
VSHDRQVRCSLAVQFSEQAKIGTPKTFIRQHSNVFRSMPLGRSWALDVCAK